MCDCVYMCACTHATACMGSACSPSSAAINPDSEIETWGRWVGLGWLADSLASVSLPPEHITMSGVFMVLQIKLRSSCLCAKRFADWAISWARFQWDSFRCLTELLGAQLPGQWDEMTHGSELQGDTGAYASQSSTLAVTFQGSSLHSRTRLPFIWGTQDSSHANTPCSPEVRQNHPALLLSVWFSMILLITSFPLSLLWQALTPPLRQDLNHPSLLPNALFLKSFFSSVSVSLQDTVHYYSFPVTAKKLFSWPVLKQLESTSCLSSAILALPELATISWICTF